jgi:hypothetical protein
VPSVVDAIDRDGKRPDAAEFGSIYLGLFERALVAAAIASPEDRQAELAFSRLGAMRPSPPRVHRGGPAGELLAKHDMPAAAVGNDVLLSTGAPSVDTNDGLKLIAHEAVHTAQQRGTQPQQFGQLSGRNWAELEANRGANGLLKGEPLGHVAAAPAVHYLGADSAARAVAKKAARWLARKGANISAHVAKRHIAKRLGKSTFIDGGKMVKKWVTEAIEHSDRVTDQGRRVVFEKLFNRKVGQAGEQIVRVVVDKATGKIVSAFPTKVFKELVGAAAAIATATAANQADAAIETRRQAIAAAHKPGWVESIIEFFLIDSSPIARDEDYLAEEQIVEQKIQEAISEIEKQLQKSLAPAEREEVREMILLEMQTEPAAGVVGD